MKSVVSLEFGRDERRATGANGRCRISSPASIAGRFALLTMLAVSSASAQPATKSDAPAAQAGAAAPTPMPAKDTAREGTASITGFRSATFGMSEADVRAAIAKDFPARAQAAKVSESPAEKTQILTVKGVDVIPGGGNADVGYVFGYKSKKLVQVTIVWSKATDAALTPDRIYANGTILRNYFVDAAYKPDTVGVDVPTREGLLMFRGADEQGHTTVLMLQGTQVAIPENKDQRVLSPTGLVLVYLADPKAPDVFRLQPGQF